MKKNNTSIVLFIFILLAAKPVLSVTWNVKTCINNKNYIAIGVKADNFIGSYIDNVKFNVKVNGKRKEYFLPDSVRTLNKGTTLYVGYFNAGELISTVEKININYTPHKIGILASCYGDCTPQAKIIFTDEPNPSCE